MAASKDELLDCEACELGACELCGQCCRFCLCEPEDDAWDGDLSDMEDDRYYWERF